MKLPLFILGILLLIAGALAYWSRPVPGALLETVTLGVGRDKVVHEVFALDQAVLGGSRHVISVKERGAAAREIFSFDFDHPARARETNFRLVPLPGARYGILLGWQLAISPARPGEPWITWNAGRDLAGWSCCNYALLRDLHLAANGEGRLTLKPIPGRAGEAPYLETRDGGRTWSVPR